VNARFRETINSIREIQMKTFEYVLGLTLALSSIDIFAHSSGHGDPLPVADCKKLNDCSREEVTKGGLGAIEKFVNSSKIDKSWKDVKRASSAEMKDGSWYVTYHNPAEPDQTKQNLYMYISRDGFLEGASLMNKLAHE
jgi:hypothetical protein